MLGRHPKTQALLKRFNELNSYTDPNFIMRYDPSKFIQESYVIDSYSRLQVRSCSGGSFSLFPRNSLHNSKVRSID